MASLIRIVCIAFAVAYAIPTAEGVKQFRLRAHRTGHSPREPIHPLSVPNEHTQIHMLISAFQDGDRCANTIQRALNKARYPDRLSFNVLQAIGPGDIICLEEFKSKLLPKLCSGRSKDCEATTLARIHVWTIPLEEGKGPVHQRGLLSERAILPGQDSMCLSTDSHMSFVEAWDDLLIQDWTTTNNEFAVLTAYPLATRDAKVAGTKSRINLCGYFLESGVPRGVTGMTLYNQEDRPKPTLTMNWAAGQSFSKCHAEKNVPVDKELRWLFTGEEVNRAVRLWTHGYDLYNPSINAVMHNYTKPNQRFWNYRGAAMPTEQGSGAARIRAFLTGKQVEGGFGMFGLGNQRTLEEYVAWSHTNLGGNWDEYLKLHKLTPNIPDGTSQPFTNPRFCESLERHPVRDVESLAKSALIK